MTLDTGRDNPRLTPDPFGPESVPGWAGWGAKNAPAVPKYVPPGTVQPFAGGVRGGGVHGLLGTPGTWSSSQTISYPHKALAALLESNNLRQILSGQQRGLKGGGLAFGFVDPSWARHTVDRNRYSPGTAHHAAVDGFGGDGGSGASVEDQKLLALKGDLLQKLLALKNQGGFANTGEISAPIPY